MKKLLAALAVVLMLSGSVWAGFPSIPTADGALLHNSLGMCPSGALIEVAIFNEGKTQLQVYNDMNGKPLAMLRYDEKEELVRAWVQKGDLVLEFTSFEALSKVTQTPCDLLPKGPNA